MKTYTFKQLSKEQKVKAIKYHTDNFLRLVCEGFQFDGPIQKKIDKAFAKAEAMQTPWFCGEYIMDAVGDWIRENGRADAEATIYYECDHNILDISKLNKES